MAVLLRKCSFCGSDIEPGFGWMYVRADGTIMYFCSSKCAKNYLKLGRNPKKVGWVRRAKKS
ncbi:MAG: 50S ribosomal protein L24e [Candidatus Korarchaeum sp.]